AALRRVGPLGDLALEKLAELFGRLADEAVAERDTFLLHVRQRQHALDIAVDLGDDVLRRALGREHRVPGGLAEFETLFFERRNVGQRRRARRAGYGEGAHLAALDVSDRAAKGRNPPRDPAGDQVRSGPR